MPLQSTEGRTFSPCLEFFPLAGGGRLAEFGMCAGFSKCLQACWGRRSDATIHVIFRASIPLSAICPSSFRSVLPRSHVSSQAMREDAFRVTRADGVSA